MIYLITNTITGDQYVGFSKDPKARFQAHKNQAKSSKSYLHRAMNKYGKENFVYEILQVEADISIDETFWIKKLDPKYNMTEGGEGGDTSDSPNWKKGMENRRSYGGEGNPMYGKHGKDNPNSKRVKVDGVIYDTITEARKLAKRSFKYVKEKGEFIL